MTKAFIESEPKGIENSNIRPVFARHETFHPRYGWLKKGFDAAIIDPEVFHREDAPVTLGVGKNMVHAIRYWCMAFKVLEESKNKRGQVQPTEFGNLLLSEPDGLDPFIENDSILWLLHWKLLSPPCLATAWYYAFNYFRRIEFIVADLITEMTEYVEESFPRFRLTESSIKKDANCLIRMYSEPRNISMVKEETIDSPFTELGLVKSGFDKGQFRFSVGEKINLPNALVVSCCLEFAGSLSRDARTVSMNNLLFSPGAPGQVFKLDEQSLFTAIERYVMYSDDVSISETAGLIQMSFRNEPIMMAKEILIDCFTGCMV